MKSTNKKCYISSVLPIRCDVVCILCKVIALGTLGLFVLPLSYASSSLSNPNQPDSAYYERLADSVYLAEGGAKASRPYGIFFKGCDWSNPSYCRQIAINTFRNTYKRYLSGIYPTHSGKEAILGHPSAKEPYQKFVPYLSKTYAPIGVRNDPNNLNINWTRNVLHFLGE